MLGCERGEERKVDESCDQLEQLADEEEGKSSVGVANLRIRG